MTVVLYYDFYINNFDIFYYNNKKTYGFPLIKDRHTYC